MGFHRSKINEYLCRNFIAEQIVSEMTTPRLRRRSSVADGNLSKLTQENMIADEGSKSYKNWLSKSTTLEDIFKHHSPDNDIQKRKDKDDKDDEHEEEYDTHATGYIYEPAKNIPYATYGAGLNYGHTNFGNLYDPHGMYGNAHNHYGTGHSGTGGLTIHSYEPGSTHSHHEDHSPKHSSKEKDLSDLFDIALTALAYLSFGMFLIHVIMCISAVHNNATTVVTMMPMMMPEPTGGGTGTAEAEDVRVGIKDNLNFRYKRDTLRYNEQINELARRVLTSIEAALIANDDRGSCLRQNLCENNKYSRTLSSTTKIWIPVWSLGMSWLSGKLITNVPSSTSMLDGLKASILGLGNANCEFIYRDCDLRQGQKKRRRRKRSV